MDRRNIIVAVGFAVARFNRRGDIGGDERVGDRHAKVGGIGVNVGPLERERFDLAVRTHPAIGQLAKQLGALGDVEIGDCGSELAFDRHRYIAVVVPVIGSDWHCSSCFAAHSRHIARP